LALAKGPNDKEEEVPFFPLLYHDSRQL